MLHQTSIRRPSRATALLLSGLVGSLAACSSSDDDDSTPTPDTTAPAASSFVQNRTLDATGQTLSVTFSEEVTAVTAEVIGNYTVSGGVNVTAASLRVNGTTVDLTLDAPAVPGDNTIAVAAGIEDAAGNASDAVAATAITSTDTTAPAAASIAGGTVSGPENDTITVVFNDNMIESEVESLANWTIESPLGSAFDATGATIAYVDSTRTATITLGAGAADQNL
ncbi:MAG: Ig-like domain-containing protein, partial [Planctomycetota bacterium]